MAEVRRLAMRKHRRRQGKLLLEGVRLVREALDQGVFITTALHSPELLQRPGGPQLLSLLQERGARLVAVDASTMSGLAGVETSQGILAVAEAARREIDTGRTLRVLVDGVQDPGNLGTILRSAHAAGVGAVYLGPGTVDPHSPKTLRAAMGSAFAIPVVELDQVAGFLDQQRALGYVLVVADVRGVQAPHQVDLTGSVLLAVGNEAHGVGPDASNRADALVRIPMPGGAESLNVAMAATILLYEAVRQRLLV